jgi:hypothetical protein
MKRSRTLYVLIALGLMLSSVQLATAMEPCADQFWPRFFYSGFTNGYLGGLVRVPSDMWVAGNDQTCLESLDNGCSNWCLAYVSSGSSWNDVILQASVQHKGGTCNEFGLVYRWMDPDNYYLFTLKDFSTAAILKCQNGEFTELASTAHAYSSHTWYTLRVETQGDLHKAFVNGTPVFTLNDDTHPRGTGGCAAYGTNVWFDNLFSILRPAPRFVP